MPKVKSFSDIFAKYKTYNPAKEGYGNVKSWGKAFAETMNTEEARVVLGENDPLFILGLTLLPSSLADLKSVFRKVIKQYHPDNGSTPDEEKAKKIIAAYAILEERIQKL